MALPVDLTTIIVTDTYEDLSGNPLSGTIEFSPSVQVTDATDNIVFGPEPIVAALDAEGTFSQVLPCTDNADLSPAGWEWVIVISVEGSGYTTQPFSAAFPSTLGATVQLRTVAAEAATPPASNSLVTEN